MVASKCGGGPQKLTREVTSRFLEPLDYILEVYFGSDFLRGDQITVYNGTNCNSEPFLMALWAVEFILSKLNSASPKPYKSTPIFIITWRGNERNSCPMMIWSWVDPRIFEIKMFQFLTSMGGSRKKFILGRRVGCGFCVPHTIGLKVCRNLIFTYWNQCRGGGYDKINPPKGNRSTSFFIDEAFEPQISIFSAKQLHTLFSGPKATKLSHSSKNLKIFVSLYKS